MKKSYKLIPLLLIVIALSGIYTSCSKEDSNSNNGEPRVIYVRATDPLKSDSLLIGSYQNNWIAIVGENLQDAQEIWFNDQQAYVTPTYITNTSILVVIPSQIPHVIDNKLKIVFLNGDTLKYDFKVLISKHTITNMKCEYVLDGGTAVIYGDFFYEPMTVTFAGGVNGELVSVEDKVIKVEVPVGVQPGQIVIKTNFGTTKSDFWFRDNRNIFISSDPFTGWWNAAYVVNSPGTGDVPAINGNYIRVKKAISSWAWTEVAGGPASAMGEISKNIPDDAILHPSDYNFKFEVNTVKPYNNNVIKFNVGLKGENNNGFSWLPPYDTQGQWQTVVIPFNEVVASYGISLEVSSEGYWARILFHGDGDLDCDMSFDNFRVVPKK